MSNLTHLFTVGQQVKILNTDFDTTDKFNNGVVKATYEDHIIVTNTDYDVDGWYEANFNLDYIYPIYNF